MSLQLGDIQLTQAATKPIDQALSEIYGIGKSTSKKFCSSLGLPYSTRLGSLSRTKQTAVVTKLIPFLAALDCSIADSLRSEVSQAMAQLRNSQSYRGVRNSKGLPVRGQKTKSNARTKRVVRGIPQRG